MENQINDCFVNNFGRKPTERELWHLINNLPKEITDLAAQWGWNDTEVGDKTFRWIKQYKDNFQ
ncbi:hypothetical protein QU593_10010 [Rossellomorea marisflavi]|uniref:hypothetical protein n=1 Tax=Rossellomorea marisflavi TaxID=189381 RepID=UPI0025B134BA|nr:hypothetical protein [Rossellomorea marisflavi]WJV20738.1 hypothetical protein QU593_10010 [Rossellomorea marisflavi]